MVRALRLYGLAITLLLPWIGGCDAPDPPEPDKPGAAQPVKPKARSISFVPASLDLAYGHVVGVTDKAITIRTDGAKELKTFPLHDALAAGKYQELASTAFSYRAADLRVGDVVSLGIHIEQKQPFCAEICIRKRPGGRVPNSPKSIDLWNDGTCQYARGQNAENDFKDFGIPLPPELKPAVPPK